MSFSPSCRLATAIVLSIAAPIAFAQSASKPSTPSVAVEGFRVCGAEFQRAPGQDLALFSSNGGLAIKRLSAEQLAASDEACAAAKGLATGLFFAYPGEVSARVGDGAEFFSADKNFSVVDPVICESYAVGGLSIGLEDSNGSIETLPGLNSVNYLIGSRELAPMSAAGDYGPLVQCQTFPFESLTSNPPDVPAGESSDTIFRARFENAADLSVEFLDESASYRIGSLDVSPGFPFSYVMRVRNIGEAAAANVRLRDFAPSAGNPAGLGPAIDVPASWSCTDQDGLSCGAGTGALPTAEFDLGFGKSRSYLIERVVPTGTPGQLTLLAAAAFSDPRASSGGSGEIATADNGNALVLELIDNQPPTVACVDDQQVALPGTVNLAEDGAAVTYTCTVTDADVGIDVVESFTVDAVASSFGPLAPVVVTPLGGDLYSFALEPLADANGNASIVLEAVDTRGAERTVAFNVAVAADNDAPSFTLITQDIDVFSDGSDPDGMFNGGLLCSAAPSGFNCEAAALDFFFGFDAGGGADEAGQSVRPVLTALGTIDAANCGINAPGENVASFFAKLPEVLPATMQPVSGDPAFALRFIYKTTASGTVFCDFVFEDSAGAVSAPVRVNFTINDPAP